MSIDGRLESRVRVSRHSRRKNSRESPVYRDPYALEILDYLGTFVWLRTDQVERLMGDTISQATVGRRLRGLYDAKLVERIQLPVNNRRIIHTLTAKGANHLKKRGYTVRYWKRKHLIPGDYKGDVKGYFKLEHPLLANEIAIRLILSARSLGYEYEYRDAASLIKKMRKKVNRVYPDKYLLITPGGNPARALDLLIEADTGKMHRSQVVAKLERYFKYLEFADRADFLGTPETNIHPYILFVTSREKKQAKRTPREFEICDWVQAFAHKIGGGDFCERVRVSHLKVLKGENIFGESFWLMPGKPESQPLYPP